MSGSRVPPYPSLPPSSILQRWTPVRLHPQIIYQSAISFSPFVFSWFAWLLRTLQLLFHLNGPLVLCSCHCYCHVCNLLNLLS